jgi:excisionase family DNA binding protein
MQLREPPPNVELWTIAKACERLSVCRRTIYNWIASGKVDYVRTPRGPIRLVSSSCFQVSRES